MLPLISTTLGLEVDSAGLLVLASAGFVGVFGTTGLGYYFLTSGLGRRTGGPPIPPKSISSSDFSNLSFFRLGSRPE